MSKQEGSPQPAEPPMTDVEAAALRLLGVRDDPGDMLIAYRAGVRDGQPRVYRTGDAEPGPEVDRVLDCQAAMWEREVDAAGSWWHCDGCSEPWLDLLHCFGPLAGLGWHDAVTSAPGGAR